MNIVTSANETNLRGWTAAHFAAMGRAGWPQELHAWKNHNNCKTKLDEVVQRLTCNHRDRIKNQRAMLLSSNLFLFSNSKTTPDTVPWLPYTQRDT